MSKHTPGTWYESDDRIREVSSDAIVATIEDGGHVEAEIFTAADRKKHARLIAAAPEMLQGLEAALSVHGDGYSWGPAARSAVAKARGIDHA